MLKVKIYSYSTYDNYTVKSCSKNVSSIVDKLIRLAAKITESYAGDIIYDIDEYLKCVDEGVQYSGFIAFRESGVCSKEYTDENAAILLQSGGYIQYWHLTYNPEIEEGKLERISITKV